MINKNLRILYIVLTLIITFSSCNNKIENKFQNEINYKLNDMPPFPYEIYEKWEEVEEPLSVEIEKILSLVQMESVKKLIKTKENEYQMNIGYRFSIIQDWLKEININKKLKQIKKVEPIEEKDLIDLKYYPEAEEIILKRFKVFQEIDKTLEDWIANIY